MKIKTKKEKKIMSYSVTIKNAEGTCKSELFAKMAKRGDLQATKITATISKTATKRIIFLFIYISPLVY